MTETTEVKEEHKESEKMPENKEEHPKTEVHNEKFNFKKWLRGSNKKEYIENISTMIIIIAAIMIALGIVLGSFIQGTIFIAILGAFFVMLGIVVYIISQVVGE